MVELLMISNSASPAASAWKAQAFIVLSSALIASLDIALLIGPKVWKAGPIAAMISVAILLGVGAMIFATRAAGFAIVIGGALLVVNQVLLAKRYVTIFGFTQLALVPYVGWWFSAFVLLVLAMVAFNVALQARKRWWLMLPVAIFIAASFPSRLSDAFFI